jgi:hypothetical protein
MRGTIQPGRGIFSAVDVSSRLDFARIRVHEARAAYERAMDDAVKTCRDWGERGLPSPDGIEAYRNALRRERAAAEAYTDALLDLNILILESKSAQAP